MRRYLIIGMGAAGVSAAQAIRKVDRSGKIVLLGDEPGGFYSRPGLAYLLTGETPERQLFPFGERDFRVLDIQTLHASALRLHTRAHQVELEGGQCLPYDRLLLATGAAAIPLQVPGSHLEGVVKLDNLEDARNILRLTSRARTAVVVGGGITALELVEGLLARGVKVHYLLRGDRYWSNVLDESESQIIENRLKEEGVRLYYHTELAEILSKNRRVQAVRTRSDEVIPCNLLAYAIGVRPRKELADRAGLRTDRGILVDEYLQTSEADVFAAGDVAQVLDPWSKKYLLDSLWSPAREQGKIAGLNMAGETHTYSKPVAINVTRLANLTTTLIGQVGGGESPDLYGIAHGDSETFRQLPDAIAAQSGFDVNRLRIMVGRSTLVGAVVMGDQTLSYPLQELIARQVDITSIRDQLLHPGASIAEILSDFWIGIQCQTEGAHRT